MKSLYIFLALSVTFFTRSVAAQNLLPGDFEAPDLSAWPTVWSRDANAVQVVRDTAEKHSGAASLKVTHIGEKDWAVSTNKKLNVAAGDIFEMSGWSKAQDLSSAQMSVVTSNAKGEVLDWSFGELTTGGTHDWQLQKRKFVVPANCASLEFRFIGNSKGTVWFDDVILQKTGNIADFRGGLSNAPLRLQNKFLAVEINPQNGVFSVTDKRSGKVWAQNYADESLIMKSAAAPDKTKARLELWDVADDLNLSATLQLSTDTPEIAVTIDGKGAQSGTINYPAPFITEKGTSLVVPVNEGIVYPVDDASVRPMQLIAYGGHGICMAWWGAFDDKSGAGVMSLLNTPDDAAVDLKRQNNLFARPIWQPQKGQFGYARKITFAFFGKGGYVAQTKRYREYAKSIGLFKTLSQKRAANPNVDLLIGAANIWNWDMKAADLCAEMKNLGMERILWSRGGNGDELKQINELGFLTGVYDIYSDVWAPGGPKWLRTEGWPDDLVWERSGEWSKGWAHHQKNPDGTITIFPGGVVSSSAWLGRAQTRIPNDLKDKPYRARFIDTVTASPWKEDWNPAHPQTRTQDKINKMRLLDYVQNDLKLVTGAETGIDASVPFLCYYEGMLSLGPYRLPDAGRDMIQYKQPTPEFLKFQIGPGYRVPLWELVYHDCTVAQWYWGDYNNKAPEVWPQRDLWNILYGTPPMYMFDKKNWDENKAKFAASYGQIAPIARRFGYDEMLSHQWLTSDHNVQKTTWKSGAQIIVNFGDKPFKIGTDELKAMSYLVK